MASPYRDHHVGPALDHDTADVLAGALAALAGRHTPAYCLDDPAVTVHLLASLHRRIEVSLPTAVARARDHGLSWAEIGDLLATTRAAACNRYRRLHLPGPDRHHRQ